MRSEIPSVCPVPTCWDCCCARTCCAISAACCSFTVSARMLASPPLAAAPWESILRLLWIWASFFSLRIWTVVSCRPFLAWSICPAFLNCPSLSLLFMIRWFVFCLHKGWFFHMMR